MKILKREEMKKISGGMPPGSCQVLLYVGDGGSSVMGNLSKSEALAYIKDFGGGRWCCDSCSTASWSIK